MSERTLKDDDRYLEVSRFELRQKHSAEFLWNCFQQFLRIHDQPFSGDGGNLIIMWRRDIDALLKADPLPEAVGGADHDARPLADRWELKAKRGDLPDDQK